jgi:hypothetical protein
MRREAVTRALALGIVLLAFGLRVHHLGFQSLWSDEGISLQRASLPLAEMLRTMPVEHAPGYFVALHFWIALAGSSDFALRLFSLIPSVLAVALGYRLARTLIGPGGAAAALAGALLLATNAFQVWYAQEARMYAWLLAVSLGATLLLPLVLGSGFSARAATPSRWKGAAGAAGANRSAWVGYVLLVAAAVYLHHFGFLLPLTHAAFVLIWLAVTRDVRGFLRWVTAGLGVLVLYALWLPRFAAIFGFSGWREPLSPWALPWRYFVAYVAGDPMPALWRDWLPWVYLVLALIGLLAWPRERRLGALLLALCAVLPIGAALALALRQPDYHERYTIMASTPVVLLAAAGVALKGKGWPKPPLQEFVRAGVLAVLIAANGLALAQLYNDAGLHKPDYRAAASRIQQNEAPGDIVLVDGPDPEKVFLHYYDGAAQVADLRPLLEASDAEVDIALSAETEGADRAWGLLYFHEPGPVQAWLARHGWPAAETNHNGIAVTLYGLAGDAGEAIAAPPADFGAAFRMSGAEVACDEGVLRDERLVCPAGELVRITSRWEAGVASPAARFSLRLYDASGRVWAADDYTPADGFAPTEDWPAGQTMEDRRGLLLPADLPPGDYRVTLRVYDPATGAVFETPQGPDAVLAEVEVTPAERAVDPAALDIPHRMETAAGVGLTLLGASAVPETLRPGREGELSVWWRAGAPIERALTVQATLGRPEAPVAQGTFPLGASADRWAAGQIVRQRHPLVVDPAATSGRYPLTLMLLDGDGAPVGPAMDAGQIAVEARPRSYRLPAMQHPTQATLGGSIALRGYDLTVPENTGEPAELTLYWQALDHVPADYKVFVHLVDEAGQIAAQSDAIPAGGDAPTMSWLAREVVTDRHALALPGPGAYRLLVGMYDPASGVRPESLDADDAPLPNNAIPLQEIRVE